MKSKKNEKKNLESGSRRNFLSKGGMAMMGGMFAWTKLSPEEMKMVADKPIADMLKLGTKGLTSTAKRLTPVDIMAITNPNSSAGKKRISSRSYLKAVTFRDMSSLSGAMSNKFGNGPILATDAEGGDGGDGGDGGGDGGDSTTIVCCCCCCCV